MYNAVHEFNLWENEHVLESKMAVKRLRGEEFDADS